MHFQLVNEGITAQINNILSSPEYDQFILMTWSGIYCRLFLLSNLIDCEVALTGLTGV